MTYWVGVAPGVWREAASVTEYYLSRASVEVASRFLDELGDAINSLEEMPSRFRNVEEFEARRVPLRSFPYLLWYRVLDDQQVVLVAALSHAAMSSRSVMRLIRGGG
ncbi:MAG: type II toxin-antitoxin system RelE/ParE family toxin [Bifidobacteriaceae bacterium]|nr:type II toxin-antitoxin system RelE/ParE family toxin [Bifidobacteriaceae bacterium]